jgi:hypothetical protein
LHLIDLDFALLDAGVAADARVQKHAGQSHEVLAGFPDQHFDWVYIDADHSFAGTSRDARAAAPKVKPGGYLVFNDFAHLDPYLGAYGVHRAVSSSPLPGTGLLPGSPMTAMRFTMCAAAAAGVVIPSLTPWPRAVRSTCGPSHQNAQKQPSIDGASRPIPAPAVSSAEAMPLP